MYGCQVALGRVRRVHAADRHPEVNVSNKSAFIRNIIFVIYVSNKYVINVSIKHVINVSNKSR
jgi:hypothetical protein